MIFALRPSLLCCLVATLTVPVLAQQAAPVPAIPDDGWSRLKELEWPAATVTQNSKLAVTPTGTSLAPVGVATPATSIAADYLSRA